MFDAKNLLEALVRGPAPQAASPAQPAAGSPTDQLADIIRQFGVGGGQSPGATAAAAKSQSADPLGGLLGQLFPDTRAQAPAAAPQASPSAPSSGGLGDLLNQFKDRLGTPQTNAAASQGSNPMDILGQIFGQLVRRPV